MVQSMYPAGTCEQLVQAEESPYCGSPSWRGRHRDGEKILTSVPELTSGVQDTSVDLQE